MTSDERVHQMALAEAITKVKGVDEADAFLRAILSKNEYAKIERRWHAFQFARNGKTYREAAKLAKVAGQTINRAKALVDHPESAILHELLHRG